MPDRLTDKVLVVGWDAADWKHIQPLLARGWMPTLQAMMDQGTWGNIATLHPILSPMLWTSIATGKRPYKHGIHGFIEPMPDGKGVRPSTSTTRSTKAIWNILTQKGMRTNVVSWFCGHPAEPINGVCVTEMYPKAMHRGTRAPSADEWPLPAGAVHPESAADALAELRVHPTELEAEDILPFVPKAAGVDQDRDRRLEVVARLLAEAASTHAAATHLMAEHPWDFMGVYYDAIDHFSHAFMRYHPPRMANVSEEDFDIYQDVIVGCYRFHDMMLGRLLQLAGPDTTVLLCSDHGFHCDHLRPLHRPREPAGPAVWHREYGILCMMGPGIQRGGRLYGASVLDVVPTVLTLLGEPVGADMDGKPLVQALDRPVVPQRIATWDDVGGEAGMHPHDRREDPFEAREAIRQLVELGYVDKPDENEERAAQSASREAKYNLARAYLDGGMLEQAAGLLEELVEVEPDTLRFGSHLARCYMAQRRFVEARRLGEALLERAERQTIAEAEQADQQRRYIETHRDELLARAEKARQEAAGKADEAAAPAADGVDAPGPPRRAPRVTEQSLRRAEERLARRAERLRDADVRATPAACLLLGTIDLAEGRLDSALAHLLRAEQSEPRLPGLHNHLGQVYLRLRRNEDAARAFRTALDIDGDSATAHEGLAAALGRLDRREEAVEHALTAVELMHNLPRAHLRLGVTLAALALYEQAAEALQVCLKLAPMTPLAHRLLARLYRVRLGRADLAAEHMLKAREAMRFRRRREASQATDGAGAIGGADMD